MIIGGSTQANSKNQFPSHKKFSENSRRSVSSIVPRRVFLQRLAQERHLQRIADDVANYFVPAVIFMAIALCSSNRSYQKECTCRTFRRGWQTYVNLPRPASNKSEDPRRNATQSRVISSAEYLRDHLQEVPVHVIPCIAARSEGMPTVMRSEVWGSIVPAVWSFMLAAHSFGPLSPQV